MKERDNHWIITYTGRQFWPLDPRPEDVDILDIAHALAMICRFGGHCLKFYSVAQHSVLVSKQCGKLALQGLLHDAAEAYLGDMTRPVKRSILGIKYKEYETRLQNCILERFNIKQDHSSIITEIDSSLLLTEKNQIVIDHDFKWTEEQGRKALPYNFAICPLSPEAAETQFLSRFDYLTKERKVVAL